MIDLCPSFTGATYEKIEKYGGVQVALPGQIHGDKGTNRISSKDGIFATKAS